MSETAESNAMFARLHPIGWAAACFAGLAAIATAAGSELLIGHMPWWMWAATVATIVLALFPGALNLIRQGIEKVSSFTGSIAMVLAWVIFALQLFNVITRYTNNWFEADILFGETTSMAWMSFGLLFLLGTNYGVKAAINPRIDFWWAEFSDTRKAWLDFLLHTTLFLPFLFLGIRVLRPYAASALGYKRFANDGAGAWPSGWRVWDSWEQSANAGELPVGPIKAFLFVGFVLWAAQIFAEMIKAGFVIAGRDDLAEIAQTDAPLRVE